MNFRLVTIGDAGISGNEAGRYLHLKLFPSDGAPTEFRTICLEADDVDVQQIGAKELGQLSRATGMVLADEKDLIGKTVNFNRGGEVVWAAPVSDDLAREYFKNKAAA